MKVIYRDFAWRASPLLEQKRQRGRFLPDRAGHLRTTRLRRRIIDGTQRLLYRWFMLPATLPPRPHVEGVVLRNYLFVTPIKNIPIDSGSTSLGGLHQPSLQYPPRNYWRNIPALDARGVSTLVQLLRIIR